MLDSLPVVSGVEFRAIESFVYYRIGDDGSAWSCNAKGGWGRVGPWRRLVAGDGGQGYLRVTLYSLGRKFTRQLHTLVLNAFVGECPDGFECRHRDGNTGNNAIGNLSWGTPKQNGVDRIQHGTGYHPTGSKNTQAKLDESKVSEIKRLYRSGQFKQTQIASRFGVTPTTVNGIIKGRDWKHVA